MVAAAVVGTVAAVGSAVASSKAAGAQRSASRTQREIAAEQNELTREQFEWNKEIYENDTRPMQQADFELRQRLINESLAAQQEQQEFAREQRQYYQDVFQPVERRMAEEAMNYDSASNVGRRAGMAAANVNQQFSNSAAQKARMMGRYGLNPNSSVFSAGADGHARAQALASAGAQTGAAFDTMDKAIALRAGVANFGRNMPNTAAQYYSNAGASGNSAANMSTGGLQNQMASMNPMNSAYGYRVNGLQTYGNNMIASYARDAAAWDNIAQGLGEVAGSMYGGMGGGGGLAGGINQVGSYFSDARLKTDLVRIGTTAGGVPTYLFRYHGDPVRRVGVVAQEAAQLFPDAVSTHPSGYLMVDYSKVH